MNTIVNTRPAKAESFNPIDRPNGKVLLNDLGVIIGTHPRPLLLIGREPVDRLPSRRAMVLLDVVLALSWDYLQSATKASTFSARGQFLRNQLCEGKRSSNDRLDEAFNELIAHDWNFPVALLSPAFRTNGVLGDWSKRSREFHWQFTPAFLSVCQNVPLWVKYPFQTSCRLKKPVEHRLHELLLVFAARRHPVWRVPLLELRRLMGATGRPVSDDRFIIAEIEPAVLKINRVTGWQVKVERLPNPIIAPTQEVRFTFVRTGTKRPAKV